MQIGVSCVRGHVTHKDCRACAAQPLHPCHLTPDMLEKLRLDPNDRHADPNAWSPTRLLDCDRKVALLTDEDWYINVEDSWPLLRGTMVHAIMENDSQYPGAVGTLRETEMEWPIETAYGPQRMTGKPDLVVLLGVDEEEGDETDLQATIDAWEQEREKERKFWGGCYDNPKNWEDQWQAPEGTRAEWVKTNMKVWEKNHPKPTAAAKRQVYRVKIVDYKSTGEIKHDLVAAKTDHVRQVNMYAWLVRRWLPAHLKGNPRVVVEELEIVYADFKKVRRFTSAGPLQAKGKMLTRKPKTYETLNLEPIHIYKDTTVQNAIRNGIESKLNAKTDLPPILEGDEAWRCLYCPVYAVCHEIGDIDE